MVTKKQGMVESVCPSHEGMNRPHIHERRVFLCLPFAGRDKSYEDWLATYKEVPAPRRRG